MNLHLLQSVEECGCDDEPKGRIWWSIFIPMTKVFCSGWVGNCFLILCFLWLHRAWGLENAVYRSQQQFDFCASLWLSLIIMHHQCRRKQSDFCSLQCGWFYKQLRVMSLPVLGKVGPKTAVAPVPRCRRTLWLTPWRTPQRQRNSSYNLMISD